MNRPWIKLSIDFFDDPAIRALSPRERCVFLWLILEAKRLARPDGKIPIWRASTRRISEEIGTKIDRQVIKKLEDQGLIYTETGKISNEKEWISIRSFEKHQSYHSARSELDQIRSDQTIYYKSRSAPQPLGASAVFDLRNPDQQPKKTAPKKAPEKTPSAHAELLAKFRAVFVAKFNREPIIQSADKSQIGRLLNSCPADCPSEKWAGKLGECLQKFVDDPDKFLVLHGHPLRLLGNKVQYYLVQSTAHVASTCPECGAACTGGVHRAGKLLHFDCSDRIAARGNPTMPADRAEHGRH